jgi:hypothetical protein
MTAEDAMAAYVKKFSVSYPIHPVKIALHLLLTEMTTHHADL